MSSTADDIARFALISRILLIAAGLPMFIFGVVGNFINIVIFAWLKQFNTLSGSIFLLFSFVASEIDLVAGFLPQVVFRLTGSNPLTNDLVICKLRWYLGPLTGVISLHCISLAAINQYLVTSRTIRLHQIITRRRAIYMSSFVAILWTVILSPMLVFYTHGTNSANATTCNIVNPIFAVYDAHLSILLYSLVPIVTLSIFSLLTWRNIRRNLLRRRTLEQSLTRMLLAQIVMVLLTTIPSAVNQMYFFYTRTVPKDPLRLAQESILSSAYIVLSFLTHSMSFYTYLLTSKVFRRNIRSLLTAKRNHVQPIVVQITTQQKRTRTNAQTNTGSRHQHQEHPNEP